MQDVRVWLAIGGLGLAVWLIAPVVVRPRPPAVSLDSIPRIHYVCRVSGEVFTLPLSGDIVDNPKTHQPTLVPAVFDPRRKAWRPGPPLEAMRRQGLLKPVP